MRKSSSFRVMLLVALPGMVSADPIHAIADGAYWHHDSGWIFPQKIGEFIRVGLPQDVAGSRDAAGWYARVVDGTRVVASVDVLAADSAADGATPSAARTELANSARALGANASESSLNLGPQGALRATRLCFTPEANAGSARVMYFVESGAWRIRIIVAAPEGVAATLPGIDEFVAAQRWDSLSGSSPR